MNRREQIAAAVLAEFGSHGLEHVAGKLVADCPGKRHHTGANQKRDFMIQLTGAPTGTCFHQSCESEVAAFNLKLRQEIGRDEGTMHKQDFGHALDWDSVIGPAMPHIDPHFIDATDLPPPARTPADDLAAYLGALFDPGEVVAYNTEAAQLDGSAKWTPQGRGTYVRTAGEILQALRTMPVDEALNATLNEEAGAWCRLNPFDGQGVADANVTEFRHALVESDGMPLEKQLALMRELNIPCAAIVHSGAKSLHAVVKIGAGKDRELYKKRVNDLYEVLQKNGFQVDSQNRNPGRLSRMPGVTRNGARQYLIATNHGAKDWAAWEEWRNEFDDKLPAFEGLAELMANPPPLAPALIDGVLRRGHKLCMSGPSKSGKTWAMMQLCVAISDGLKWFGHTCLTGRVLYVDMELDKASSVDRFARVCQALDATGAQIDVWHLRSKVTGMAEMIPKLIRRLAGRDYVAVILDPLYMLLMYEDENSNGDMARFLRHLDRVCETGGIAVVFSHHFSKGMQGAKKSIDRGSGAGAIARFPDAVLTMSELESEDAPEDAFVVEYSLREFKRPAPRACFFRWPIHVMDDAGALSGAKVQGAGGRPKRATGDALLLALQSLDMGGDENPSLEAVLAAHNACSKKPVSERTLRRRIEEMDPERGGWRFDSGKFWKLD